MAPAATRRSEAWETERPDRAAASGRFGVTRSQRGRRSRSRLPTAAPSEQARAGLGDHDGIEHDVDRAVPAQPSGDGANAGRVEEHSDLDGTGAQVGKHRVDLPRQKTARERLDPADAPGVLGGSGRQHGGPVHAVGREGQKVRLDPGAAAGVGRGDRDGRRRALAHTIILCPPKRFPSRSPRKQPTAFARSPISHVRSSACATCWDAEERDSGSPSKRTPPTRDIASRSPGFRSSWTSTRSGSSGGPSSKSIRILPAKDFAWTIPTP